MTRDRSIHRMLLLRVALATVVVSVPAAAIVTYREHGRTGQLALERAEQAAGLMRLQLQPQLDTGLADHAAVQDFLDRLRRSPAGAASGRFVEVAILDAGRGEVARAAMAGRPGLEAAERIPVDLPLLDSAGRVAGHVTASFEVSAQERAEARRRLAGSIALAVGMVLATAALIYPVVGRLMRRLERLSLSLLDANLETLGVVGSAIAKRDSDTDAHNFRVTVYAAHLAEAAGLTGDAMRGLIKGAFLHDVGKLGTPDAVLHKPGKLDASEFGEMKRHVAHGLDIIGRSAWLRDATPVVGHHHEKWDGSGYGSGLRGEAIPLAARIFAVADVFDALASRRPYKEPLSVDETLAILEQGRGSHFDPSLLDLFAPRARELHRRVAGEDGAASRAEVTALMERHFRGNLGALLGDGAGTTPA
jgi:HD-GYP domain-containing protein (c-di-GMP phosphodiesterase class II)